MDLVDQAAALPTHFERFVLSGCSPCVKESFPVKTVAIAVVKLPAFPRVATGLQSRHGEIVFAIVRASARAPRAPVARAPRDALGGVRGRRRPLPRGSRRAGRRRCRRPRRRAVRDGWAPEPAGPETVEIAFHAGSLRVGVVRMRGEAMAYVQAGQIPILMFRPVWEVPNTVFLSVSDLPTLTAAIVEVAAKIRALRGG